MSPSLASLFPLREIAVASLAEHLGGRWIGPQSDATLKVRGITTLEVAGSTQVSFLSSDKFQSQARESKAAVLLVRQGITLDPARSVIEVPDVWTAVIATIEFFCPPAPPRTERYSGTWVSPQATVGSDVEIGTNAVIEDGARIGNRVRIGAHCYIGRGVILGDDCVLHPRVTLLDGVELGNRVICHPGCVIGADGFKYEVIGGRLTKIPQVGTVIIENDVEIGANTTIDRASLTETRIGARTKIDNMVHIAHNVTVGHDTLIIAQVGIAGSTHIGSGCVLAGQAGLADNIKIADGVRIGARSGISSSITDPGDYLGAPARPIREEARILMSLPKLPELIRQVRTLLKEKENKETKG